MNKDAIIKELNGQSLKLIEAFTNKEKALQIIKEQERKIEDLNIVIKELAGIVQTLQFMLQTEGFTNIKKTTPGQPFKLEEVLEQENK